MPPSVFLKNQYLYGLEINLACINMNVLAIIPARGGSKGVPDKNIRPIAGKPLIAYAIDCAKESRLVHHIVVSTDSPKIANIVGGHGAEILMRPSDLAQDDTPMPPVLLHVLDTLQDKGQHYDLVVLLQVTSPIRTGQDIDHVVEMFVSAPDLEAVISVVPIDDVHPARMYTLNEDQWMIPYIESGEEARRQDLPVVYYRNGCIYAIRSEILKDKKSLMVKNKKAYIMPAKWLANIDDERDLIIAEALIQMWKAGQL